MNMDISPIIKDEAYRSALSLPSDISESYSMLAQGEYNINYIFAHPATGRKLVLRINMGSQMHLDRQIEYEAHALELLKESGRTPEVYYVDGSGRLIEQGFLVMDYLPGDHLHYSDAGEMKAAMECLADIHSLPVPSDEVIYGEPGSVPRDTVKLIAPADSSIAILDECESMVKVYMDSPLGDSSVRQRLRSMLDRGHELADCNKPVLNGSDAHAACAEGYRCCINTELNSTNFLADRGYVRLVDWEKPLYGDPAQDLGHMLAPTTTFWKTDFVLSSAETDRLIDEYITAVRGRFDTAGIKERTLRLINITCLRGLTWCAMAWVQYKDPEKAVVNESTRKKLDAYLSEEFLADIEGRLMPT